MPFNYRDTDFYKQLTPFRATMICEGASDEDVDPDEYMAAWQYLHDKRLAYTLQGWFGRRASEYVSAGLIHQ